MFLYRINDHHFVTILLILTLPFPGQTLIPALIPDNNETNNGPPENIKTPNEKTPLYIIIGILAGLILFVLVALIVMYLGHKRIVERYKQRPIPTLPMVCTKCHEVYSPRSNSPGIPEQA